MNTPRVEPWSIPGTDGEPILGDTHLPADGTAARGTLLIAHGFKGYKDYGFLPMLAARAADEGFVAHRFNFSHSGMTNEIDTFARPELFERDTWGRQTDDLNAVAEAVKQGDLPSATEAKRHPVFWFGHSRGGVTCLLTAARLTRENKAHPLLPAGIVTAASPHVASSLSEEDKTKLREEGRLLSPSGRTGQDLYVGKAWLDDIEAHPEAHDPYRAAGVYPGLRLVVHGTSDATVPVSAAHAYADAVGGHAELVLIEGASHTFDAPNPLPIDADPPPATRQAIDATIDFLQSHRGHDAP